MMAELIPLLLEGTGETLAMVSLSLFFSVLLGLPAGIVLTLTKPDGIVPRKRTYAILGWTVDTMRSIPFVILMMLLIPFSRFVVGTSIGTAGAIVPLSVAAAPFVARVVEAALAELPPTLIETVVAIGATPWQIVRKVYLVETLPGLVRQIPIVAIALLGSSAMAGAAGGGGLGDIAIRYGYYNYRTDVMLVTILILIVLVEAVQLAMNAIARRIDRRRP